MKEGLSQEVIAMRAVKEIKDGDYVNLGYGIPNLCAMFALADKEIVFQAENGVLGYGSLVQQDEWAEADFDYIDAGIRFFHPKPGMCFFDMGVSFDMIWGGHLDLTVMGALEVSEKGDLANWTRGGKESGGIGGSMDLAASARRVIVCMEHTTRNGSPRILKQCRLPLTARACVDLIITSLGVLEVTGDGLLLKEIAPGWTVDEVQELTEPKLIPAPDLKEVEL